MGLQKTWCVAKPSSSLATLLKNINFACSQVDCGCLQQGGACATPANVFNHASVAMNLYYQSRGRNAWNCEFENSGLVTVSDPSKWSSIILYRVTEKFELKFMFLFVIFGYSLAENGDICTHFAGYGGCSYV